MSVFSNILSGFVKNLQNIYIIDFLRFDGFAILLPIEKDGRNLDIQIDTDSIWNGMIKINSRKYLGKSFLDSEDFGGRLRQRLLKPEMHYEVG